MTWPFSMFKKSPCEAPRMEKKEERVYDVTCPACFRPYSVTGQVFLDRTHKCPWCVKDAGQ